MIASVLRDWFGWDGGAVLTNLVASALWFVPGFLFGLHHAKKLHVKLDRLHRHLGVPSEDNDTGL